MPRCCVNSTELLKWHMATTCAPAPAREDRQEQWMLDSGAQALMERSGDFRQYDDYCRSQPAPEAEQQILKDVSRTSNTVPVDALRRILLAHAVRNPHIGYTQGLNFVGATLLREASSEDDAFWLLCAITELLLPQHYLPSLIGVRTDALVLDHLLLEHGSLADLPSVFDGAGFELGVVTPHWLMLAFCETLPHELTLRVWDLFFSLGSRVLLATALALMGLQAPRLREASSSFGSIYALLRQPDISSLPASEFLGALLFELHFLTDARVGMLRSKFRPTKPLEPHEYRQFRFAFRHRGRQGSSWSRARMHATPRKFDAFDMVV